MKDTLLGWVERDREKLITFLREFVRCKSPNPPGDTLEAAAFVRKHFRERDIRFEEIAPVADRPNFIATFDTGRPGPHLVLNGHIDVFPVESTAGWTKDPWGAELVNDRIYGRGACDMKCGTTASIMAFTYLNEIRGRLRGKLTLTVVSDEESFSPPGMRHLMDHHREKVLGDVCLNGEPSSPYTVRFGEKGPIWGRFTARAKGGHGAFVHMSRNAILVAMDAIAELRDLPNRIPVNEPPELARALDEAGPDLDRAYGPGAGKVIRQLTVNIGRIEGGVKVNMIAAECTFEADIRIPNGASFEAAKAEIEAIARRHSLEADLFIASPPNWREPFHPLMDIVRENASLLKPGLVPARVVSPGATDARLWRLNGVPAVVYGPSPHGMGSVDENVSVEEYFHVVKSHLLSAWDFLKR